MSDHDQDISELENDPDFDTEPDYVFEDDYFERGERRTISSSRLRRLREMANNPFLDMAIVDRMDKDLDMLRMELHRHMVRIAGDIDDEKRMRDYICNEADIKMKSRSEDDEAAEAICSLSAAAKLTAKSIEDMRIVMSQYETIRDISVELYHKIQELGACVIADTDDPGPICGRIDDIVCEMDSRYEFIKELADRYKARLMAVSNILKKIRSGGRSPRTGEYLSRDGYPMPIELPSRPFPASTPVGPPDQDMLNGRTDPEDK